MIWQCRVCGLEFPYSQRTTFLAHVPRCVERNADFIDGQRPRAPFTGDPELASFARAEATSTTAVPAPASNPDRRRHADHTAGSSGRRRRSYGVRRRWPLSARQAGRPRAGVGSCDPRRRRQALKNGRSLTEILAARTTPSSRPRAELRRAADVLPPRKRTRRSTDASGSPSPVRTAGGV
jgi:hypothetical protein